MSNPWALLMLAITAEVLGTSCLRLSEGMTKPLPTVLVFSAYAIAMALLSKVVLSIPLGLTYALWSGIGTIAIVLVGWLAYQQTLSVAQLIGIGMITSGVVLVNIGQ
ncbi:MAG: multidrug efflux SMR transporter [Synechococcus sp. TMED20]|jgi:small multidrug resistance pump|nr:MAG: multidrug efflux SMR transporter [Synechococcus sp. TMED20]|tara:strand:- start:182 stop:502 length:321 start_codon:yes stop_codon:yes gene_type:complete